MLSGFYCFQSSARASKLHAAYGSISDTDIFDEALRCRHTLIVSPDAVTRKATFPP